MSPNAPRIAILTLAVMLCGPATAGMKEARDAFVTRDFATAHAELQRPAQSGNAEAEAMLGLLYAVGLGRPRDPVRAFDWYLRAASRGLPSAQAQLAHLYETGQGLPAPDAMRAYAWFTLAALGGDPDAARDRDRLRADLRQIEIDHARTLVEDYAALFYPSRQAR